jgi:thioredoxin 1
MSIQREIKAADINSSNFEQEVLQSDLPVLVDFWASWCMPCIMMAPVLDEIAQKFDGKLRVLKINTEEQENQHIAYAYDVRSIPNLKLFHNGKMIKDFVGFRPVEVFEEELEDALKNI